MKPLTLNNSSLGDTSGQEKPNITSLSRSKFGRKSKASDGVAETNARADFRDHSNRRPHLITPRVAFDVPPDLARRFRDVDGERTQCMPLGSSLDLIQTRRVRGRH